MKPSHWPLQKSLFILIGSTLLTLSVSIGGYTLFRYMRQSKLHSKEYEIAAIVQTGPEKEALKSSYLAELLDLSLDAPTNLYAVDSKKLALQLLASPLIKSCEIKKLFPNTLYIDYETRKPLAWIADYRNIAIDAEGYLLPVSPFLPPKEIPELYLGLPAFGAPEDGQGRKGGLWNTPLENQHLRVALDVLRIFEGSQWHEGLKLLRIDVSNAFAPTLGRREIVLFTEECITVEQKGKPLNFVFPKILRLGSKRYQEQLDHFFTLRKTMAADYRKQLAMQETSTHFAPRIIDLRIEQLAFVENSIK